MPGTNEGRKECQCLPVYEDSPARFKSILDEFVRRRKVLEQIIVFYIVHFDYHVLKAFEKLLLQGKSENR